MIKTRGLWIKVSILLFPLLFIFYLFYLRDRNINFYFELVSEDNIVEYLTSLFYFISSIVAVTISVSFLKQQQKFLGVMYAIFALGMFLIAGEEISWGQRIFNFQSSQFFIEYNRQDEVTIHNLEYIQFLQSEVFMLIGFLGGFLWMTRFMNVEKNVDKYEKFITPYLIPGWYLMGYFIPALVYFTYHNFVNPKNNFLGLLSPDQELAEFVLCMGFLLFSVINRNRQIQEFNLPRPELF